MTTLTYIFFLLPIFFLFFLFFFLIFSFFFFFLSFFLTPISLIFFLFLSLSLSLTPHITTGSATADGPTMPTMTILLRPPLVSFLFFFFSLSLSLSSHISLPHPHVGCPSHHCYQRFHYSITNASDATTDQQSPPSPATAPHLQPYFPCLYFSLSLSLSLYLSCFSTPTLILSIFILEVSLSFFLLISTVLCLGFGLCLRDLWILDLNGY